MSSSVLTDEEERSQLDKEVTMCMRTSQTAQWKTLFDTLKDVIPETRVAFNDVGLKIVTKDQSNKYALIHLEISSEFYYCAEPVTVGVNLVQLYRMLRSLTCSGYFLQFTLRTDTPGYLNVTIDNCDQKIKITHQLQLLDIPGATIDIEPCISNRVLSMPSVHLQRYIKELASVSDRIKIVSTRDHLELSADGKFGTTCMQIGYTANGLHCKHRDVISDADHDEHIVISESYPAKFLEKFTKPLDTTVTMYFKHDYPLVLRYCLPSATIRLVLAPLQEQKSP
jgi:proliferating cell nuclear antigen PCNA